VPAIYKLESAAYTNRNAEKVVRVLQAPPATVGQAQQLEGITWDAKQGALVPLFPDFDANCPQQFLPGHVFISSSALTNTDSLVYGYADTAVDPGLVNTSQHLTAGVLSLPFNQSGAYFTGLSEQTMLTLTARFLVEVFPTPYSSLYALARPSPPYDPRVGELLNVLMADLHPGYPVGMNAKGDFFKKVLGGLGKVYKTVQPVLVRGLATSADPRAQAAVSALTMGEEIRKDVAKAIRDSKSSKKK